MGKINEKTIKAAFDPKVSSVTCTFSSQSRLIFIKIRALSHFTVHHKVVIHINLISRRNSIEKNRNEQVKIHTTAILGSLSRSHKSVKND